MISGYKDIWMAKIPYCAKDSSGDEVTGYIEATTNGEALSELQARGLQSISLHGDASTSFARSDLTGLAEKDLQALARWGRRIRDIQAIPRRKHGADAHRQKIAPALE